MSGNELRPLARELVDSARQAQTPTEAHRDRAYQALLAGLGGAATVGTAKTATSTAKVAGNAALGWLKWAVVPAVLASAGLGAYVYAAHRRAAPTPSVSVALAPAPSAALGVLGESGASPPAGEVEALSASSAPAGANPPTPPKAQSSAKSGDLGEELSLLHQALAESRSGNALRALELARQHARQFPNSHLRVERDAIEVRSLCVLGRAAEAHKIADRLRSQAPNSPVSAALEETCVGK